MKRFMVLHFGFEPPTSEIMEIWGWLMGDPLLRRCHD